MSKMIQETLDLFVSSENNDDKCLVVRETLLFVNEDIYYPALHIDCTLYNVSKYKNVFLKEYRNNKFIC